ncbi:MAG: TIGR04282 family arsenosugar biosynthesis glycosyltransferase [Nitrospirota bacterium]
MPEYGKVKKRLAAEIGEEAALKAYESMLNSTIDNVSKLKGVNVYGFFEGENIFTLTLIPSRQGQGDINEISIKGRGYSLLSSPERDRVREKQFPCEPQQGYYLGERMYNAIKELFNRGYEKVSLIGADSPDLPLSFIVEAFRRLESYDLVIGPSEDGGYYLIGVNKAREILFKNVRWGTDTVLRDTINIADDAAIRYFLLPIWYDIDNLDSLNRWKRNHSMLSF